MRKGMIRHTSRLVVVTWVVAAVRLGAAQADAAPASSAAPTGLLTIDGLPARRVAIDQPIDRSVAASAAVSPTLYLERCRGGCTVHKGANSAQGYASTIPTVQTATISEFENATHLSGTAADADWAAIVQCMREVYSPYNVTVTDVKPGAGVGYNMAIIAGHPSEIGLTADILGVAPLASDCSPIDNVISFSFANQHAAADRVLNICWTAAQESAHAYGLDHEYAFVTGNRSACNDPMTYRNDCGGEKFFRNEAAKCGENAVRACKCGATQNSHQKVLSVFGAGTPSTGNPTAVISAPVTGGPFGSAVAAQAGARRGVARVALYLNDYKWTEVPGSAFGMHGQPNPDAYSIPIPSGVPNSIIDIKVVASDDLDASTQSAVVTVTKGAPCVTADTCAKGQKCEAGKCFWDPPMGEIGADCAYPQFCKTGVCQGTKDQQICTQPCTPGQADACPSGFDCAMQTATTGVCFFSSGGCCSVDRGDTAWWAHFGLAAVVLGSAARRRRR